MSEEVPSWPQLRGRINAGGYDTAIGRLRWSDATADWDPRQPRRGTSRFTQAPGERLLVVDDDGVQHVQDGRCVFVRDARGRMIRHEWHPNIAPPHVDGHPWTLFGNHLDRRGERFSDETDYSRPTGQAVPVTVAGRRAWEVTLAPPPRKTHPLLVAVDDLTGTVLRMSGAAGRWSLELLEFIPHAPVDLSVFRWDGPFEHPDVEPPEPAPERVPTAEERAQLRARERILAALVGAVDRRAEVLQECGAAADPDQALARLRQRFDLDRDQATAVLDLQLRRLTVESARRLRQELTDLRGLLAGR